LGHKKIQIKDNTSNNVEAYAPRDVFQVLSHKFLDFKHTIEALIAQQATLLSKIKSHLITSLKSYSIVEPTEKETKDTDEAMAELYSIGTDKFPDCIEKMNRFCAYNIFFSS